MEGVTTRTMYITVTWRNKGCHTVIMDKVNKIESTNKTATYYKTTTGRWSSNSETPDQPNLIVNSGVHLPTSSTCIDPAFTDQPNLIVNSGVHLSLHKNCHHQTIFFKWNIKIE